jgi:hypothetical protein
MKTIETKKEIIDTFYECGNSWFIDALFEKFTFEPIGGDFDYSIHSAIIPNDSYTEETSLAPISFEFYQRCSCGCEHDCCGHRSSITIKVVNNENGFVTVFLTTRFNY